MVKDESAKIKFTQMGLTEDILNSTDYTFYKSKKGNYIISYHGGGMQLAFSEQGKVISGDSEANMWNGIWTSTFARTCRMPDLVAHTVDIGPMLSNEINNSPYSDYIEGYSLIKQKKNYYLEIIPKKDAPVNFSSKICLGSAMNDGKMLNQYKKAKLISGVKDSIRIEIREKYQSVWETISNDLINCGIDVKTAGLLSILGISKRDINAIIRAFQTKKPSTSDETLIADPYGHISYERANLKIIYDLKTKESIKSDAYYVKLIEKIRETNDTLQLAQEIVDKFNASVTTKMLTIGDKKKKGYQITKKFDNFIRTYTSEFSSEELADVKKAIIADQKEDQEETARIYKEQIEQIDSSPYSNTLLTYCSLEIIRQNDRYLTENAVVDIVRGMATSHDGYRKPVKYAKMFRMISDDEVRSVIRWLNLNDVIDTHYVNGYYQDYYTLEIKDEILANHILANCQQMKNITEKIGKEPITDICLLGLIQNKAEFEKTGVKAYMEVFEHPYVFCIMEQEIYALFRKAPESVKYYIKTAAEVEDGLKKKICSMIKKNILQD